MLIVNKLGLLKAFDNAKNEDYDYVFVVIEAEGIKECIVVPRESFDEKEKFYSKAYNDNLVHVMNRNVRIINVGYGNKNHLTYFI